MLFHCVKQSAWDKYLQLWFHHKLSLWWNASAILTDVAKLSSIAVVCFFTHISLFPHLLPTWNFTFSIWLTVSFHIKYAEPHLVLFLWSVHLLCSFLKIGFLEIFLLICYNSLYIKERKPSWYNWQFFFKLYFFFLLYFQWLLLLGLFICILIHLWPLSTNNFSLGCVLLFCIFPTIFQFF